MAIVTVLFLTYGISFLRSEASFDLPFIFLLSSFLPSFLPSSLSHSPSPLSLCLAHSLIACIYSSLSPCLTQSLSHSVPVSLSPCLTQSLSHSVPVSLTTHQSTHPFTSLFTRPPTDSVRLCTLHFAYIYIYIYTPAATERRGEGQRTD